MNHFIRDYFAQLSNDRKSGGKILLPGKPHKMLKNPLVFITWSNLPLASALIVSKIFSKRKFQRIKEKTFAVALWSFFHMLIQTNSWSNEPDSYFQISTVSIERLQNKAKEEMIHINDD